MTADGPRLSPFVGLADTTLRFVLLSLATLAAAGYAWQYIHAAVLALSGPPELCIGISLTDPSPPYSSAQARCWAQNQAHPLAISMAFGVALTAAVSVVIFLIVPLVTARVRGLYRLDGSGETAGQADVNEIAGRLETSQPRLLADPRPEGTARMSAGGFGRPALVLGAGMAQVRARRPEHFRAVVAHELSHLRNADVRLAELSVAAWWALLIAVVVPYVVSTVVAGDPGSTMVSTGRFVILLLLTRLLRNSLLAAREMDADIRASTLPDLRPALEDLLGRDAGRSLRRRAWSPHPSATRRLLAVRQPARVLRASRVDLVSLGATGYFLLPALAYGLQQMSYGLAAMTTLNDAAAWIVAVGVGAGVWAVSWRQAVAERMTGRERGSALGGAWWLSCGLALGALLIPLPREVGGLLERHSAGQWLSFAVAAYLGSLLLLAIVLGLARRFVARAPSLRRARQLSGVGLVLAMATTALVLNLFRTFVLFSMMGMTVGGSALVTAASVLFRPVSWLIVLVAMLSTLGFVGRLPRLAKDVWPAWMVLADQPRRRRTDQNVST